jgi:hypothetical protein
MWAAASVLRSEDWLQAARLSVAVLTARAYVEWQEVQLDQGLLADELALQAEVLRIVQVRVRAGFAPQIDLDRVRADAAAIEAEAAAAVLQVLVSARKPWTVFAVLVGWPACRCCKVSSRGHARWTCCDCSPICALSSVH